MKTYSTVLSDGLSIKTRTENTPLSKAVKYIKHSVLLQYRILQILQKPGSFTNKTMLLVKEMAG